MDLVNLAKQVVEFRKALLKETSDQAFINNMCGQYLLCYMNLILTANTQKH